MSTRPLNQGNSGPDAAEIARRKAAAEEAKRQAAEEAKRKAAEQARQQQRMQRDKFAKTQPLRHEGTQPAGKDTQQLMNKRAELQAKRAELQELQLEVKGREQTLKQAETAKKENDNRPWYKKAADWVSDKVNDTFDSAKNLFNEAKGKVENLSGEIAKLEQELEEMATKVVDTAKDVAATASDVVGAGVAETAQSLRDGQGVLDSLKDGLGASAEKAFTEVIDPTLDKSVLGQDNEFQDDGAGALGPVLTNRLGVGESVSLKIEAGATIPTQLVGAPNVKADAGGTMQIKRVAVTDENGKPVMEADGKTPKTKLEVRLELEARAGASYSASVGFDATAQVGGYEAGAKLGARAEAEAGLTGKVAFTFEFDPDSAEEMGHLTGMVKETAQTSASAMIPGAGPVLAAMNAEDTAKALDNFGKHLVTLEGEGGLYAQATANASAQVGVFKGKPEEGAAAAEAPQENKGIAGQAADMAVDKAKDHAEGSVLDKLKLDVANLSASLGGEFKVGGKVNFKTGDRTVYVTASGAANASGGVMGLGTGAAVDGNRTIALTYGKDGKLKNVAVEQEMTKEKFMGIRTTVEDVFGRPLNDGLIAQVGSSDTIRVRYELKPEHLERIEAGLKGGPTDKARAMAELADVAISKDKYKLGDGAVTATHTEEVAFKAGLQLNLGAQIGARGGVTLQHKQETSLT